MVAFCPSAHRQDFYVEDAQQAIYALKDAIKNARLNKLYFDQGTFTSTSDADLHECRVADPIERM